MVLCHTFLPAISAGKITKNQAIYTWKGTYYEPGKGSVGGKFELKLDSSDSDKKYTGSFSATHTYDLSSNTKVTGKSISSKMPSDAECFRADLDYIVDPAKGFVNGLCSCTNT